MDIIFVSDRIARLCNDSKMAVRKLGPKAAKLLRQRLDELHAAETLQDLDPRFLPHPHCHELRGNLAGKLSVNLDHPRRLLFEPADEPVPRRFDGGLNWSQVTGVRIMEIRDTHE